MWRLQPFEQPGGDKWTEVVFDASICGLNKAAAGYSDGSIGSGGRYCVEVVMAIVISILVLLQT